MLQLFMILDRHEITMSYLVNVGNIIYDTFILIH